MRRRNGFTLLELLVVIGIIILITAVMVPMIASFLGGSGIQSGQRIVQGVLMKARSLAVNTRRQYVVIFDAKYDPGNPGQLSAHMAFDHRDPAHQVDEVEEVYSGKLIIWDIDQPINPADPTQVECRKIPGEYTLPKNVSFSYAPSFCLFNSDGSMVMGRFDFTHWQNWYTGQNVTTGYANSAAAHALLNVATTDASSQNFEDRVAEKLRKGNPVDSDVSLIPYDLKVVRKGGGGKACYVNLVSLTGRVGKWMVGDRVEDYP